MLIRQKADITIVDNALLMRELYLRGFHKGSIEVNSPGIDVSLYMNNAFEPYSGFDALFLGRLHPSKGVFSLIDIWERVCAVREDAHLAVVGRGDPMIVEEMTSLVEARQLGRNVSLLGFVPTEDAIRLLRSVRILVSPSFEEGFGMAILEALASGTPVVAWDLPVYREVFPRGLKRAPVGDVDSFASHVCELLADGSERSCLAEEGKEVAKQYEWEERAHKEAQLIAQALANVGVGSNGRSTRARKQ
ncbi:MAG: glycosyltransferase [Chloroflexi bacterium]|nr:glycosyltransferase [Chloroflexota bacterium]